ncbi:MAG: ATP phosphoribosyltransferase [Rhodospirillales bacterium]|nr:ATP phosphoribosyltransferase [Rhodospirillales bacterium]MCB9997014.1 ATP phosphoribosyltransferase [Rhodospirillales bacterium]
MTTANAVQRAPQAAPQILPQAAPRTEQPFRVILPKKGRLRDDFAAILTRAGLNTDRQNSRLDFGTTADARGKMGSFETLLQRPADAIENLKAGIADMAVVGLDTYEEARCADPENMADLQIACTFNGVSACGLWIAAAEDFDMEDASQLAGLRIATSYPNTLRVWLEEQGIDDVEILARDGGIEDYIRLGLADAICDVVDTGTTLAANGLDKKLKIMDSTAVLVERTSPRSEAIARQVEQVKNRLGQTPDKQTATADRPAPINAGQPAFCPA